MPKIIVTGVDDSETALKAAHKAAAFAFAFDSELYVVSAYNVALTETIQTVRGRNRPTDAAEAYESVVARAEQKARGIASEVATVLRNAYPELKVIPKAVEGHPGAVISGEADHLAADLIVVGNKRVQGPTRIFGSVARTIAQETDCDLYIVNTS